MSCIYEAIPALGEKLQKRDTFTNWQEPKRKFVDSGEVGINNHEVELRREGLGDMIEFGWDKEGHRRSGTVELDNPS
jgi:hypothetical protein